MTGVAAVYRWELVKLLAQKRTYLGVGAAALVPIIFVSVLVFQTGGPTDVPLGRYIRDTGLAVPFVVLFFMSIWGLPLITALVAGDIVASESHNGTLKTILTRSRERGQVFAGKVLAALTYTAIVVVAMAAIGLVAGSLAWGLHPLTSLSGTEVSAGHGLALLTASVAIYFLPLAGIAAFGLMLSTLTRNSAASVVGTLMFALLMQLLGSVARNRELPGVSPGDPVRRMAWVPASSGGLGSGDPRVVGQRALHRGSTLGRLSRLRSPRRHQRVTRARLSARCR